MVQNEKLINSQNYQVVLTVQEYQGKYQNNYFFARITQIQQFLLFILLIQKTRGQVLKKMYNQKVIIPEQFPLAQKNRKSTDVCCTLAAAIVSLTMFIVACCMFNRANYNQHFIPSNENGKICGVDQKDKPLLYFPNPKDISKRQCVSECPIGYYKQKVGNGQVCLPKNVDSRNDALQNSGLNQAWDYQNSKSALGWTVGISLFFGILWMCFVHIFPKLAPIVSLIGSAFFLFILGIVIAADPQSFWANHGALRVLLSLFCFFLMGVMLIMLVMYSNSTKFQGYFLEYSVRFLSVNPSVFGYIPIFIVLTIGLVCLSVWQHVCFSSGSFLKDTSIFYTFGYNFWIIMNILEFIWGMQFLRDAFNFCVSGYAVDWYWTEKQTFMMPLKRLITKNWGSVVGGSLLNAFFEIPTLLVELVTCHPHACCSRLGTFCYNSCSFATCFFDLVRTDSYSYINLAGIPYCNSSRQCKKLCEKSKHFTGSFSPLKHYRLAAHIFNCSILFLICYGILKHKTWNFKFWAIALLIVVIYQCVTFFIDIHADTAEGLQTCFLVEYELEGQYPYLKKCLPSIRKHMEKSEVKNVYDGNC